jgi:hypothetical protein
MISIGFLGWQIDALALRKQQENKGRTTFTNLRLRTHLPLGPGMQRGRSYMRWGRIFTSDDDLLFPKVTVSRVTDSFQSIVN